MVGQRVPALLSRGELRRSMAVVLKLCLLQIVVFGASRLAGRDSISVINIDFLVALAISFWSRKFGALAFCAVGLLALADFVAGTYHFDLLLPFLMQASNLQWDMLASNLVLIACCALAALALAGAGRWLGPVHPLVAAMVCLLVLVVDALQGSNGTLRPTDRFRNFGNIDIASSTLVRLMVQATNPTVVVDPSHLPVSTSALNHLTIDPARSVILIVVESLGALNADARTHYGYKKVFDAPSSLSVVSSGLVTTAGGTMAGEYRELCDVKVASVVLLSSYSGCRPWKFRQSGYATVGVHSYRANFFDRAKWWPKAGFETKVFKNDRVGSYPSCRGALDALCDGPMLQGELRRTLSKGKFFLYFLSSNTHLPISSEQSLESMLKAALGTMLNAVDKELAASGRRDVDIVVVGDHPPPLMGRSRNHYLRDVVPYWILRRQ